MSFSSPLSELHGTEEQARDFLESLDKAMVSSGLSNLPQVLISRLSLPSGNSSPVLHGPYYYRLSTSSKFPYLEMRLYEGTLPVAFTLGYKGASSSLSKRYNVEVIGELVVFNPTKTKEDRDGFYFEQIVKHAPEVERYIRRLSDGHTYARISQSASPWGSVVPDYCRVSLLSNIGLSDITLDVAYRIGSVYLPLAVLTLSVGLLDHHVLSVGWE